MSTNQGFSRVARRALSGVLFEHDLGGYPLDVLGDVLSGVFRGGGDDQGELPLRLVDADPDGLLERATRRRELVDVDEVLDLPAPRLQTAPAALAEPGGCRDEVLAPRAHATV
jgi:hypothetical protein